MTHIPRTGGDVVLFVDPRCRVIFRLHQLSRLLVSDRGLSSSNQLPQSYHGEVYKQQSHP
jgi:hypothetical protein